MIYNQSCNINMLDRLRGKVWFTIGGRPFYRQGALLCATILFILALLIPSLREYFGPIPAFLILMVTVYIAGMLLVKITLPSGRDI